MKNQSSCLWAQELYEEWIKNPPRLLGTFGHRETEEASIKIIDNFDEDGCVPENLFPGGRGLYDLGCGMVVKDGDKWRPIPEFWKRIHMKHPEERNYLFKKEKD